MQCYSELIPPSGVTHSIHLAFTAPEASNLIVGRTSLLQIFSNKQIDQGSDVKLVLVAEYSLPGSITALGKVTPLNSKSGGDALLVAFRDAKLSLIEWDPAQHSISTISIHYYENHDLLLCPWSPDLSDCVSHLTIDPNNRCAAFNFGINNLAIMPFHQGGDDLAMDDLDDSDAELEPSQTRQTNGEINGHNTPYAPSFVLPLTALEPGLLHPVGLSFLHEYRDPTIGVLYSTQAQATNLAPVRKDVMIYAVYTLDIEQRASTTLQSTPKLPNDLYKVVAIPPPVGGTLLIGANELVHIDQGGRANAIGVNEFAKECSSFPMADQSDLRLRLEGCQVEQLGAPSTDLLIALATGELIRLAFRLDGRSVSGLSLQRIDRSLSGSLIRTSVSTITCISQGHLFFGSEMSDSVLVRIGKNTTHLKRQNSRAFLDDTNGEVQVDDDDDDLEEDEGDDDDLYADSVAAGHSLQSGGLEGNHITLLDSLPCIGPIQDIAVGRPTFKPGNNMDTRDELGLSNAKLDLVLACGKGSAGTLAVMSRSITPTVVKKEKFTALTGVWSLSSEPHEEGTLARPFDDIIVVSEDHDSGDRNTNLLSVTAGAVGQLEANDFERGDSAVAAGQLASGMNVVVYPTEVRAYDKQFGLAQIFPIVDEEADATAKVLSASIVDRYILILKEDCSIVLLKTDKSGDLDEVELPESVPSADVLSASLFEDTGDFFGTTRYYPSSNAQTVPTLLVILTNDSTFSIQSLPNLSIQVFQHRGLNFLPLQLSPDYPIPKHWRNKDDLAEVLLANIGDYSDQVPHLIVRNTTLDLVTYQPFQVPSVEGAFRFRKVAYRNADEEEEYEVQEGVLSTPRLLPMSDVGGYAAVLVSGSSPSIIMKTASSGPKIYRLDTGPIRHASSFHNSSCNRGFVYIDSSQSLCFSELPSEIIIGLSDWSIKRLGLSEEVSSVTFYPRTQSYVLATNYTVPFHLPREDEWHPEWEAKNERASDSFLPTNTQSTLKLLSSTSHSVISQHQFEPNERILTLKCLNLEISEQTHERKDMIVVGTAIILGENVVTRGMLYIFDIVDVVPHPDIPETDVKLKLITKEDVRGAVTAVCDVGSQGFVLASQGQKCMVRGLREDNAILPVAFLDVRYHVNVAKELKGTGMTILGDAFSGLWLVGYSEEPYKLQLLGRDLEDPPVLAAEFLPQNKQLYVISSNADGELRVLHYDPEDPKTERGSVLLLRSTFNTGSAVTTMTLLPRTATPGELLNASNDQDAMDMDDGASLMQHQILVTTQEGGLGLLVPLSEHAYRRLSTLQNILLTQLEHPCGLNPRAYRAVETDGLGGRGIIDGSLIRRWLEQSSQHKGNTADRVGGTIWEVRADLEVITGGGLSYF